MRTLQAPFPWFGGKSRVAAEIWRRFGDTPNYVEPFFGSGAVLLGRPERHLRKRRTETVNDADGLLANFWRAVAIDPDMVAAHADWPVSEVDYHARLAYIQNLRPRFTARMEADPELFDPRLAGWWVYVVCAGIGDPFGPGPWHVIDGELCKLPHLGDAGQGINRKLPHLGNAGRGINRKLPHLGDAGRGINRELPHLGDAGRGINRELPHLGDAGQGINRELPHLGNAGQGITTWMRALAARLRGTRITCGDWTRVVSDAITVRHGTTAVFLDPPYSDTHDMASIYAHDSGTVAHDVRDWALANGDNPALRIALCGYAGEHDTLADAGWDTYIWKAHGGYGGGRGGTGDANSRRERIWFSPHCHSGHHQHSLFDEETA